MFTASRKLYEIFFGNLRTGKVIMFRKTESLGETKNGIFFKMVDILGNPSQSQSKAKGLVSTMILILSLLYFTLYYYSS